jgi:hypothetical protein
MSETGFRWLIDRVLLKELPSQATKSPYVASARPAGGLLPYRADQVTLPNFPSRNRDQRRDAELITTLRWNRTGRRRWTRLSEPPVLNPRIIPRVISEPAPHQQPECGEGRRQPRPETLIDSAGARTPVVSVRIGIAGI